MTQTPGLYAPLLDEGIVENVRRHLIIQAIPHVTERVIEIGQSYEARLARKHLASLSAERRAELEKEWNDGR